MSAARRPIPGCIAAFLAVLAAGCVASGPASLVGEGDALLVDADRALGRDAPDEASDLYQEAFLRYAECLDTVRTIRTEGRRVHPAAEEAEAAAKARRPLAAIGVAATRYETAVSEWKGGDRRFEARDFAAALEHYEAALEASETEERWLRIAAGRLAALPPPQEGDPLYGKAGEVSDDLARVAEDRRQLAENIRLADRGAQATSAIIGQAIGDAALATASAIGEGLRVVGLVTLEVITHPAFWECLRIALHLCPHR